MCSSFTVSRSNWNFEVLVFVQGGKSANSEQSPRSKNENQQKTKKKNSTRVAQKSNPGYIGERRELLPLRYSRLPMTVRVTVHSFKALIAKEKAHLAAVGFEPTPPKRLYWCLKSAP